MQTTAVKQWGNSAGVRISKEVLEQSKIKVNDVLDIITISNGTITLQKRERKRFSDYDGPLVDTTGFVFDREEINER
jgi:antitoxin component of MazEF toxin-antitoxin module